MIRVFISILLLFLYSETYCQDKIGIGLGGIGSVSMEFTDASKTMRSFDGATLDENGYPQRDFQIVVFDARPCCPWLGSVDDPQAFVPELMAGKYKLSFDGQASIASTGNPVQIQNQYYDADENRTTVDIVVSKNNWLVQLSFTGTKRSATSATGTGITNITLLRPGYHNRGDDIFRQELLNAVSHFPVIRFMDFIESNNSNPDFPGTTEWADRVLPDDALFEGTSPWEYVVGLANETSRDIWINIPIAASDEYVEQLAQFLKVNLHSEVKIYFEYSNEVWNGGFTQYTYNREAAIAEVEQEINGGDATTLNDDTGECDPEDENLWAGRRYVRRMKEFTDIFVETFSPGDRSSFETKVRPVFAWQIGGWIPYYSCILTWFESVYGDGSAKDYFYGLAGAAYVNAEGAASNASPELIQAKMISNSDAGRGKLRDTPTTWWTGEGKIGLRQIADLFGIRMLQYETGPDNGGGSEVNVANRIAANRTDGMKDVLLHDLGENWFDDDQIKGEMVMYFVLASSYNRYGSWGATEALENMHTPKLKAIYELAGIVEDNEGPTFPENVNVTMNGSDAVVTWDAASDNVGVTHYRISDATGAIATVLSGEPLTVTLPNVNSADVDKIKVIAVDAFNNPSGFSNVVTGLKGESESEGVIVFPNPVKDETVVSFSDPVKKGCVVVSDLLGHQLIKVEIRSLTDKVELSLGNLPGGFYTIQVFNGKRRLTQKIFKE